MRLATLKARLTGQQDGVDALATLTEDDIHGALSNSRRRHVISYLAQGDDPATIGELATYIACVEYDATPEALTSDQRKNVYVAIYQCHLPKLDELDIVDFGREDVHATPRTHALDDIRRETNRRLGGETA